MPGEPFDNPPRQATPETRDPIQPLRLLRRLCHASPNEGKVISAEEKAEGSDVPSALARPAGPM